MTGRRTRAFALLLAFIAAFSLMPSYSARADECDIVYRAFKSKHPTADPKEAVKQLGEAMSRVFDPDARPEGRRLTEDEFQSSQCTTARKILNEQREFKAERRRVDAACGSRLRWTCDNACLARYLEQDKQRADHECDPARFEEIRQRERNFESFKANAQLCIERFSDPVEENLEDPLWPAWIKACNGAGQDYCRQIWLTLEDKGLPTKGLTCVPTARDRDAYRQQNPKSEASQSKSTSDPARFDDACGMMMVITVSGVSDDKLARYITDCSRHPKKDVCLKSAQFLKDNHHAVPPKLVCQGGG